MTSARIAQTLGMMLLGLVLISGCADNSPVAPVSEQSGPSARGMYVTTTCGAMLNGTMTSGSSATSTDCSQVTSITAVVWPVPNQPTDVLKDSVYVTPSSSGTVKVKWSNWDPSHNKLSTVSFTLKIPAGAVASPKTISITVDKNAPQITAEFGPSGLVFLKPALLDVSASGLDLSASSATSHIDLWYVNNTGWVGTMQYSRFLFSPLRGSLIAQDVQIPHFSRYCFGR